MDFGQIWDFVFHLDKTLGTFITQYGTWVYVFLALIVFCETALIVTPFLPGDSLLFISGAFCATGVMNIWILLSLLLVCAVAGDSVNYAIGRYIGEKVFTHNYRFINRKSLMMTQAFFDKHGGKTIVLARFVPIVRTFAPFVAGATEMHYGRFWLFNVLGAFIWVVGVGVAGYFFGNIPFIRNHMHIIAIVGVTAAAAPVVLGGFWKLVKR